MTKINRRNLLQTGIALAIPPGLVTAIAGCSQSNKKESGTKNSQQTESSAKSNPQKKNANSQAEGEPVKIQYLEIVTPEVDALCQQYSSIYDIKFSEPNASFGGARTADMDGGGMIGIRGPMRETEKPVVRPYVLVDDIKAAVEAAEKSGAKVAMPPMAIPDHGQFAIVIHGGIDCGFWQN